MTTTEETKAKAAEPNALTPGDDWGDARPTVIPKSTFWPAGLAFGITFLMWGLLTSNVLILVGLLVFVVSLVGWIGELRHEEKAS